MDAERDLLLVVSDHGNLEDLRTKEHTQNSVPALIVGKGNEEMAKVLQKKKDQTGILPAIEAWFEQNPYL